MIGDRVVTHAAEIVSICENRGFVNVRVVGSVARGEEGADSDLDLLCDTNRRGSLLDRAAVVAKLETLLQVKVDIITTWPHNKPEMRARLDADAIAILEFAAKLRASRKNGVA